jgi:hypothetical protein
MFYRKISQRKNSKMNDNSKEIKKHNKDTQGPNPLKHIKNTTGDKNIGIAGQPETLQRLSKLSARAFTQPSEDHSESDTSINSEDMDTLADEYFRKNKRSASSENIQEQIKITKYNTGSHFDVRSKELQYDTKQTLPNIYERLSQSESTRDARFLNPGYLGIMGIRDTDISKNNEVSSKPLENIEEHSQYQREFSLAEEKAQKTIESLQNLENTSLPDDIKAVIAKLRFNIYETRSTLEDYPDADQYSAEHSEAWTGLMQLSELTEIQGNSFVDCLKSYQAYLDDYAFHEDLVNGTIKGLKGQRNCAEGGQRQIIEFFIDKIRHKFESINPDPIDTKLNSKMPVNQITEKYHPEILKAALELENFNNLISEVNKEINNYIDYYKEYQEQRQTHDDLANSKIEELRKWQSQAKEKQQQRIEDFIGIIKQEFRKIKEDPIDIQLNRDSLIRKTITECNEKITEAFKDLSNFTPLATDSSDEFISKIKDEIKLDEIKSLSIDTVKREITQLKPQASPFGNALSQELHQFLPLLKMIEEYAENKFDDRYKDQMLKIHKDINENYLNNKKSNQTIKDTIYNIGFRQQQPETLHSSNDASGNKEKEAGLDQQEERNRITHILSKLKSLQKGTGIKVMADGASGLDQLKSYLGSRIIKEDEKLIERCRKTAPQIRSLRDQIVSHDITKPSWPKTTMEDLKEIETALLKKRKNTNRLIDALQNQIKIFSDDFHTQQQE